MDNFEFFSSHSLKKVKIGEINLNGITQDKRLSFQHMISIKVISEISYILCTKCLKFGLSFTLKNIS